MTCFRLIAFVKAGSVLRGELVMFMLLGTGRTKFGQSHSVFVIKQRVWIRADQFGAATSTSTCWRQYTADSADANTYSGGACRFGTGIFLTGAKQKRSRWCAADRRQILAASPFRSRRTWATTLSFRKPSAPFLQTRYYPRKERLVARFLARGRERRD